MDEKEDLVPDQEEEEVEEEDGWKTRAPGLKRGVQLSGGMPLSVDHGCGADEAADEFLAEMLGQQSITAKARRRRTEGNASPELQVSRLGDDQEDGEVAESNGNAGPSKKNVDDLLPIGVSQAISC